MIHGSPTTQEDRFPLDITTQSSAPNSNGNNHRLQTRMNDFMPVVLSLGVNRFMLVFCYYCEFKTSLVCKFDVIDRADSGAGLRCG